jgi:hypothetical protein
LDSPGFSELALPAWEGIVFCNNNLVMVKELFENVLELKCVETGWEIYGFAGVVDVFIGGHNIKCSVNQRSCELNQFLSEGWSLSVSVCCVHISDIYDLFWEL